MPLLAQRIFSGIRSKSRLPGFRQAVALPPSIQERSDLGLREDGKPCSAASFLRSHGADIIVAAFFAPGRAESDYPIQQGFLEADIVTGFLAFQPFVAKDFFAFGQEFLVED
jgi:hypothetical protein